MLVTRLLTVIILLPLVLWIITTGPSWTMFLLLLVALLVSVFEMAMMLLPRLDEVLRNYVRFEPAANSSGDRDANPMAYSAHGRIPHYYVLAGFCSTVMGLLFSASVYFDATEGRGVLVLGLVLSMLAAVFATRGIEAEMARVLGFILTFVYAGFPWLAIWELYKLAPGGVYVLLVLVIVWLGDTGGYFGGRFWGKTKLAPLKSPKKTWEGAVAGLTASMGGAVAFFYLYDPSLPGGIHGAILCGFFGGIVGQLGDLVESVFKRFTKVKDSGALLPGHGGLLDRIDAVLFAAPVIWFILSWQTFRF